MPAKETKNASVCKRSLLISAKVRTILGTKQLVTKAVQTIERIHLHLDYQDIEFKITFIDIQTSKNGTNGLSENS